GTLSVCGMFTNFSALTRLPLADATAISFASPLITVALAALVLKERVRISLVGGDRRLCWGDRHAHSAFRL
ncbi:MAG: EamA family transporter, partial [Pseudolabrys sp.]